MATFLLILKIIGIVLLCVLGLALLLILVVLFVPVRYRIRASYDDEPYLKARVTYLLWLFGVTATYDKALKVVLRILFIPLRLLPRKNRRDSGKKAVPDSVKTEAAGSDGQSEGDSDNGADTGDKTDRSADKKGHKLGDEPDKSAEGEKSGTLDKIKAYADLLNAPETIGAWDVCKYRLGKLLKILIPAHTDIRVRYGLDDPYMTSVIMSVYNVFYIYLGRGLTIEPVYYEKTVSVQAKISGHIMLAPVLWQALMVLLNKDCRRFLKRFKKIR